MADKLIVEGTTSLENSVVPEPHETLNFVYQVAGFIADGDLVDGDDGEEEYSMENDDAWETINALIHEARQILRLPDVMEH